MIQNLIKKALPQIFKQTFKNLNIGLYKNEIVAFHITAQTSKNNFIKCKLTKIKKDLTKEEIFFDMDNVDFEKILNNN